MLLSKGKVFLLSADPASEKPTVQKLQNLSPSPSTHTVRMAENKEGGGEIIIYLLFYLKSVSKGKVFLLSSDPASEKPTVQKLQNLSPPSLPPTHTHIVRMAENKEGGGEIIIYLLFCLKSKSILFNSILNFVI